MKKICTTMTWGHGTCILVILCIGRAYADGLPPDPTNAALLYYQAFALRPAPSPSEQRALGAVINGVCTAEGIVEIETYLRRCARTLELAEAAMAVPLCDWGIRYSKGFSDESTYLEKMRDLAYLLLADAHLLATDGQYRDAFERCLSIRRLAAHIGDDGYFPYVVSLSTDEIALMGIRRVLGAMPPEPVVLNWLDTRLQAIEKPTVSPFRALRVQLELALQTMRVQPVPLQKARHAERDDTNGEDDLAEDKYVVDEKFLDQVAKPYSQFLEAALAAVDADRPYEETYVAIQTGLRQLEEEHGDNPVARGLLKGFADRVFAAYGVYMRTLARRNALDVAINVYLVESVTNRLPDALPEGLPPDPYSGEVFHYEKTEDGFLLQCRVKDFSSGLQQYRFQVGTR